MRPRGLGIGVMVSAGLGACAIGGDDVAPSPPRQLTAVAAAGLVELSWADPSDSPDFVGTAIARWPDSAPVRDPDPDLQLAAGRSLPGGGVVLYLGVDERFVDGALDRCQGFLYRAYATDDAGLHSAPGTEVAVAARASIAPPGAPPRMVSAELEPGGIRVGWSAAATPTDHLRVVHRVGDPPAGPGDGEVLLDAPGAGELLDPVEGLEPDATHHYAVFACDACDVCEELGAHAAVRAPPSFDEPPRDLMVEPRGPVVRFSWTAPAPELWETMRLLVREGAPVEGPGDPDARPLAEVDAASAEVATTTFLPDVEGWPHDYHFSVFACVGGSCEGAGARAERRFSLPEALRGGGHVLYLRHGEADLCADRTDLGTAADTEVPGWWSSCERDCDVATAAQLSDLGLAQAEAVGEALAELEVPIDRVLASEMCRAVETAERVQAIPARSIEVRQELTPFVYGDAARCDAVTALLGGAALGAPTANAVLVGHADEPSPCLGLEDLAPAETAIVRPTGEGPRVVARVGSNSWGRLR